MARLTWRQVWLSLLVVALFAPVYLSSGLPGLRPAWFAHRVAGLPLSVWLVLALIAIFVVFVGLFARVSFGAPDDADDAEGGGR